MQLLITSISANAEKNRPYRSAHRVYSYQETSVSR